MPSIVTAFLFLAVVVTRFTSVAHSNEPPQVIYESIGCGIGSTFSKPMGIFFDRVAGECYVADTGNHQIVVCDRNGIPLYRFRHNIITKNGKPTPGEPKSIVVDAAGRLFVTDALASYIGVLDHRGRVITRIEPPEDHANSRFEHLALGPDGKVYATLTGEVTRVLVLSPEFDVERTVALDVTPSDRTCVTALAVGDDGRIYVTDPCGPKMVQIYDANGAYVMGFGEHDSGFENFSFPSGIVLMSNGNMWIVDSIRQVASCFSPDGKFLSYVGGKGVGPGTFNFPSSIATDGEEYLFVLERGGNRYQCFEFVDHESE